VDGQKFGGPFVAEAMVYILLFAIFALSPLDLLIEIEDAQKSTGLALWLLTMYSYVSPA